MKATIIAVSALMGFAACNREARNDTDEAAREAAEESREAAGEMGETGQRAERRIDTAAGQTGRTIGETAEDAASNVAEGTRQAGRAIGDAAGSAAAKTKEETRQASRDIKEAFDGDKGKTEADKALSTRIRNTLKNDKGVSREAADVDISTEDGMVNLTGTVATAEAKREIARIASDIAGKAKVDDDVKVAERVGAGSGD